MGVQTDKTSHRDPMVPLIGSGEMGKRIHAFNWSQTDVWPVVGPQSEIVHSQGQATWNESVRVKQAASEVV